MNKVHALLLILFIMLSGCALGGSRYVIVNGGTGDRIDPLSIDEHLNLGAIYESKGLFEAALKEYRSVVNLSPNDSRGHFGVGNVYLKSRNFHLAEEAFRRAIELNPDVGLYYNNLAWVYIETIRPVEAIVTVSNALSLDMERRHIYLDTLGVAETLVGNYIAAEQYLKEAALIISPVDIDGQIHIYENLLTLYLKSDNKEGVVKVREKLLDLRRGMPAIMDL